jgi:hypothetical protein
MGGLHVWDSATGDLRFETALGHSLDTAAFSQETVDASSGKLLRSYAQQKDLVGHLHPPAGQAVAVSYFNENSAHIPPPVMVFDVSSGNVRAQWMPDAPVIGGGWIADRPLLLATSTPEALHIWSLG